MRFFGQVPHRYHVLTADATRGIGRMDDPNLEDLRAAMTLFRQLYRDTEPTSAVRVLKLLRQSARDRGGPRCAQAISELRDLGRVLRRAAKRGGGMRITLQAPSGGTRAIETRQIVDAYLHGWCLHSGNEHRAMLATLDRLYPIPQFDLYAVMHDSSRAYLVLAEHVDAVLSCTAIAPPPLEPATAPPATRPA